MSDELEALKRSWKEVDVEAIKVAMETGKLRRRHSTSQWLMALLAVLLVGELVFAALAPTPWFLKLPMVAVLATLTAGFLPFCWRQQRALWAADALLQRPAPDVVRGRIALLGVERHAWRGPEARIAEALSAPLWLLLLVGVLASAPWPGLLVWALSAVGLVGFFAYGRLLRVPALDREIAELERLAGALGEPDGAQRHRS